MSSRIARQRRARVIAVDLVPERLRLAERYGIEIVNSDAEEDVAARSVT